MVAGPLKALKQERPPRHCQIEQMRELDERQVKQLKEALSFVRKSWWIYPDWAWFAGALAGISVILFVSRETFPIVGAMLVSGYCVLQLGFRIGHQEGFARGFEDGNSSGVDKALGIAAEDMNDILERSIEMQIDDSIIKSMDKKK
jgi:hypothetical protein